MVVVRGNGGGLRGEKGDFLGDLQGEEGEYITG